MKTPHLLVSFAVAATAAAADFKDPAAVARTWDDRLVQSPPPLTDNLSLRAQATPALPPPPGQIVSSNCWGTAKPDLLEPLLETPSRLRESLIDAPRYRVPEVLPNNVPMPRGAKPWLYGGQTYWVLPLIPSREK